ncbi:MAG: DUF2784 domain-containing protein [Planctomycetia bacterium]|nr:DUF2784 domain-containing protein [Planctomycetia bacterium]
MWYGLAADLVVAIHVAYVAYVVLGQLAICIAAPMKWQWAKNPWFRFTHLGAIGYVAYEAIFSIRCPLTIWEEKLRELAGQAPSGSETFLGRLLHDLLFIENQPESFFTALYLGMLLIVVQGLVMYPPRWFRFSRKPKTEAAPAPVTA